MLRTGMTLVVAALLLSPRAALAQDDWAQEGAMTPAPRAQAETEEGPPVPFWVSMPASLAIAATGYVLLIPQLSLTHVLGFKDGADRRRAYLGLGLLCLGPPVGLGLSGANWPTVLTAPVLEAGAIGLAFGLAYVNDKAFGVGGSSTAGKLLAARFLGVPMLGLTIPVILTAALFPISGAFIPGYLLEQESSRSSQPTFGFLPMPGGGVATVAGTF